MPFFVCRCMDAYNYIDYFVSFLIAERHCSELTAKVYSPVLSEFVEFMKETYGCSNWNDVDSRYVREWIVMLMKKGYSTLTVNKKLSALRSFYRFMLVRGYVKTNPMQKVRGPKNEKRLPEFVRENEMNTLLDKIVFKEDYEGSRNRLILLMFYSTGMRLAELVGLDLSSIDFYTSSIKVHGKRNKERIIPFGQELRDELKKFLCMRSQQMHDLNTPALLLGTNGKRISRYTVEKVVHDYLSQVTTLKKCSPHVLRHTFATAMLNNGAEIEVVRQLLGHKSIATTEIYTHTTFEELKKAYAKAHPRADKKD